MMQVLGFVFGIFGLMAYLELSQLKKRVKTLEEQLTKVEGTTYAEDRQSLQKIVRSCIGRSVRLEMKEDERDADIMMYGNTKHGSNTILDADDAWMLVEVKGPKQVKRKLIRLESISRIGTENEENN